MIETRDYIFLMPLKTHLYTVSSNTWDKKEEGQLERERFPTSVSFNCHSELAWHEEVQREREAASGKSSSE